MLMRLHSVGATASRPNQNINGNDVNHVMSFLNRFLLVSNAPVRVLGPVKKLVACQKQALLKSAEDMGFALPFLHGPEGRSKCRSNCMCCY